MMQWLSGCLRPSPLHPQLLGNEIGPPLGRPVQGSHPSHSPTMPISTSS